ncbi:hypothetical protein KKB44_06165 [Candidatus Micrarchaeota archaeon]|nr:hypothetical protein [Candidatus Micrarchaeota archaeon]
MTHTFISVLFVSPNIKNIEVYEKMPVKRKGTKKKVKGKKKASAKKKSSKKKRKR